MHVKVIKLFIILDFWLLYCVCHRMGPHLYISGFLFLDPEDITNLSKGAIWNFGKVTGPFYPSIRIWSTKGLLGLGELAHKGLNPNAIPFSSVLCKRMNII